jgi:hypothetical protein
MPIPECLVVQIQCGRPVGNGERLAYINVPMWNYSPASANTAELIADNGGRPVDLCSGPLHDIPPSEALFQLSVLLGQLYKPRDDCLGNTQDNPATTFIRCFARSDELNLGYDISGTSQLAICGIFLTLNDWK